MNITIRNLPKEIVSKLKSLSKQAKRSLNSEILFRLERSVNELNDSKYANSVSSQHRKLSSILGKWEDDRSTQEIITDIYSNRTIGREYNL